MQEIMLQIKSLLYGSHRWKPSAIHGDSPQVGEGPIKEGACDYTFITFTILRLQNPIPLCLSFHLTKRTSLMGISSILAFSSYQICYEGKRVPVVNCEGSPALCFKESLNKMITHSEALNKVQTEQSSPAKVEGKFPLSRWLPRAGQHQNQDTQPGSLLVLLLDCC